MSGVPMPLSSRVAVPDGGKLAGMRMIVVSTPRSSSTSQNGLPLTEQFDRAARQRNLPLAELQRSGRLPPSSTSTGYGTIVFGSRWMKSKMPCAPGSRPVMKVDHATGLCGGIVVPSGANAPRLREPLEIRHPPARHQVARERVVHAVEAEHDHARSRCAAGRCRRRRDQKHRNRREDARVARTLMRAPCSGRAVHVSRRFDAEQAQRGRRDVDQRRLLVVDVPVAEEHAGHQARIDAVIAAPRLDVVLEDRPADDAGRAVPRRAVAGVVADQQVRARSRDTGPGTAPTCRTPRGCRLRAFSVVASAHSACSMISAFSASTPAPGSTMPCCSRPCDVQEHAGQAEAVGLRPASSRRRAAIPPRPSAPSLSTR